MHTYRKDKDGPIWTVGYWRSDRNGFTRWEPLTDFSLESLAIERVNYLNGGNGHVEVEVLEP